MRVSTLNSANYSLVDLSYTMDFDGITIEDDVFPDVEEDFHNQSPISVSTTELADTPVKSESVEYQSHAMTRPITPLPPSPVKLAILGSLPKCR